MCTRRSTNSRSLPEPGDRGGQHVYRQDGALGGHLPGGNGPGRVPGKGRPVTANCGVHQPPGRGASGRGVGCRPWPRWIAPRRWPAAGQASRWEPACSPAGAAGLVAHHPTFSSEVGKMPCTWSLSKCNDTLLQSAFQRSSWAWQRQRRLPPVSRSVLANSK